MLWKETNILITFYFGGKYFRTYLAIKVRVQTKTAVKFSYQPVLLGIKQYVTFILMSFCLYQ